MKIYTLLLIGTFLHFTAGLFAQYSPTALEGATWVVFDNQGGGGLIDEHRVLRIAGDTLLEGRQYKKLYRHQYYPLTYEISEARAPYRIGAPYLYALLRDDTVSRKLYGRVPLSPTERTLSPDTLVHDYAAEVGDSLDGVFWYTPLVVERVYAIDTFGLRRRVQTTDEDTFIEGIGSLGEGPIPVVESFIAAMGYHGLLDYCNGDTCGFDLINPTRELRPSVLDIYPNPAATEITLSGLTELGARATISVYDARGRYVAGKVVAGVARTSVDVTAFSPGIYTVVVSADRAYARVRFVRR